MTYLQFHLAFVLPPLLALLALRRLRPGRSPALRRLPLALAALVLVALVYTTPWDNLLVAKGVWGYPPGRVWFALGYVPIEEYMFFVLQTVLTGLWLARLWPRLPSGGAPVRLARPVGVAVFAAVSVAGVLALTQASGLYLGLVLVWAGPVLALQWGFGGDLLASRWKLLVATIAPATLYLAVADRIAILAGIWSIAESSTTGIELFGLPLEEGVFFLATNAMIAFGLSLVLDPRSPARLSRWRALAATWRARATGIRRSLRRPTAWRALLGLWALSMVPIPLLGKEFFVPLAYVSTGLLTLGVTGLAVTRAGPRALWAAGVAVVVGWAIEAVGSRTGIPFGPYRYLAAGPEALGVPLLVPLGWWAFTAIAIRVAWPRWRVAGVAAALVAWDLGLDPLMVSQGLWRFQPAGDYFGVPLTNFVGWGLVGGALALLLVRIAPGLTAGRDTDAQVAYVVQAALIGTGLALFGMPVAGAVAGLAMLAVATLSERPGRLRFLLARVVEGAIGAMVPAIVWLSLRRGLAGVWGRAEAPLPDGGLVVAANHHSWWDGYLAFLLARRLGRPLTVLMNEDQLRRFPFFRAQGAIPAHRVRTALRRLERGHMVVVFVEGSLGSPGTLGPLAPGAVYLARRSGRPLLPVAFRVTMRGAQRPEAFIRLGTAIASHHSGPGDVLDSALGDLVARLDGEIRQGDPEAPSPAGERWLEGRASTDRRMAWGVRLWGRGA